MGFLQGSVRPPGRVRSRRARRIFTGLLLTASASGGGVLASASPPASASGLPATAAARRVLAQALAPHQPIRSGVIGLDLRVVPRGSATGTGPVELSFDGPFQSRGPGHVPAVDLTVALRAQGRQGSLQLISTGGHAYVTLGGQSYRLPASSYRRLASELRSLAPSPGAGHPGPGSSALMLLGADPLGWLQHPRIVGHPQLAGTPTTHVAAGLDPSGLLQGLDRTLRQAGSLGLPGTSTLATKLSTALPRRLARALGAPRVDVWIGSADGVLERLRLAATMPVTGSLRATLGAARSAAVTLSLEYRHLNQPQTVTAPTTTQPYSVFRTEALLLLAQLESGLTAGSSGTSTTGG